ncbi:hypothetical protein ACJV2T_01355 [Gardnerella sp. Marseille-Q9179]|uniref:hypothetical protein n=1 Tax=Gardnerella sp. Marseille-Q9179 TaxID=3383028 RepID=UPI003AF5BA1B
MTYNPFYNNFVLFASCLRLLPHPRKLSAASSGSVSSDSALSVRAFFSRAADFSFTPLRSFCRIFARSRPKLYATVKFLPFSALSRLFLYAAVKFLSLFRLFATFSLHCCAVSAATYRSALSVRTFCPRPCKVFAAFSRVPDFSFTQLHSFCRLLLRIRPFLYSAVNFLPFFSRLADRFFTPL